MTTTDFNVQRSSPASRITLVLGAAWLVMATTLPFWGEASWMREMVEFSCYFIFAMMWNLLAGYGGMVSVGQQAFFGLGGYLMLALSDLGGINPFVAIPLAALGAGVMAVPLSWIAFRLQGGYFAIGTWVIAEVLRLTVANIAAVGGGSGTSLTALRGLSRLVRQQTTYWIAVACVVACIVGIYLFLRSKQGLALQAIRDNPVAAESQGIAVGRMKLRVYMVAAAGCGLAGALYFVGNLRISPDAAFGVNWTAFAIFIVVIGGIGRIEGPMVGAVLFWLMNKFLADYGTWYQMGLGLLAIAVTLFFRQGLWGVVQGWIGSSLFPTQRVLVVSAPSASAARGPAAERAGSAAPTALSPPCAQNS
ncbi:amino acid/amide ABC transporter membrane protein 2 (HAAT family) [Sphaerotilus hippei]|uniref:Amino acid/amide ABC transporter membrane protein 2 (HAAT family) n=1 Tax=Sphaerotilus hippei TaxID=744406 RepID=A0A318HAV7_9BURK|nr:branched-chain amino acid ABC transporter permease [Sphaerotilus hippei]PXW97622.1 amino acid/amide ABC transporter membrane protein 2 (HAAT family) [Sphaerotilus hippei]